MRAGLRNELPRAFGFALSVCLACTLACSAARADDWLAVLPACAQPSSGAPVLALLYPRSGLPAVVHAGDTLIARVRLPAALTPPPGVQQERALSGWSAFMVGQGLIFGTVSASVHKHALAIVQVRPDGASSLVYRVSLVVPAYAAPGTYSLSLRTPFGQQQADGVVRVLATGAKVRLARLRTELSQLPAGELASWPVDVWVGSASQAVQGAQPLLVLDALPVALRVGGTLLVNEAQCQEQAAFTAEVSALAMAEKRERIASAAVIAVIAAPLPSAALQLHMTGSQLEVSNRDRLSTRELVLLIARGRRVSVSGGELTFYPASDLWLRDPDAVVAWLRVGPSSQAHVQLTEPERAPELFLSHPQVTTGAPVTLQVYGAPKTAKVAFDLGFARSALVGPTWQATFSAPGSQPIAALVLLPDGLAIPLRSELWVQAKRPAGCGAVPAMHSVAASMAFWFLLSVAGLLLKRRGRPGIGNRLRR